MLNLKNILGFKKDDVVASGFNMGRMGKGFLGSPVFFNSKDCVDVFSNSEKQATSRILAVTATTLTPWCTHSLLTCGRGTLFQRTNIAINEISFSEQNCFINKVKTIEIDDIDQISDISNPPDLTEKVKREGAIVIAPNNFKVMDKLVKMVYGIINFFPYSLLHSNYITKAIRTSKDNKCFYTQCPWRNSSTYIAPVCIIIDARHCLPFYEFNKHTGMLVAFMSLLCNERTEDVIPLTHLSFFLSDSDEGLYVIDGEVLLSEACPIQLENIYYFISAVTTVGFLDKNDTTAIKPQSIKSIRPQSIKIKSIKPQSVESNSDASIHRVKQYQKQQPQPSEDIVMKMAEDIAQKYNTKIAQKPAKLSYGVKRVAQYSHAKKVQTFKFTPEHFKRSLLGGAIKIKDPRHPEVPKGHISDVKISGQFKNEVVKQPLHKLPNTKYYYVEEADNIREVEEVDNIRRKMALGKPELADPPEDIKRGDKKVREKHAATKDVPTNDTRYIKKMEIDYSQETAASSATYHQSTYKVKK